MTTKNEKKNPWLDVTEAGAVIRLRRVSECNGVKIDRLSMRAPTVKDVRTARKAAGEDSADHEMQLFASLCEVSLKDLEGLTMVDYDRLQAAYFRLVADDGAVAGDGA